jgi:polyferredoxin
MLIVGGVMLTAWMNRALLEVNVLHDRNPVFVQLSDGSLRNGYTVKILNKQHVPRSFRIAISGLEGAGMTIVGMSGPEPTIDVVTDDLRALKVLVTVPATKRDALTSQATPFRFALIDARDGGVVYHDATFRGPGNE